MVAVQTTTSNTRRGRGRRYLKTWIKNGECLYPIMLYGTVFHVSCMFVFFRIEEKSEIFRGRTPKQIRISTDYAHEEYAILILSNLTGGFQQWKTTM